MKTNLFSLVAALLILAATMAGQDTRGAISGRISDPSGAVIPGATVVITNAATGFKITANANQDGLYRATFLMPGAYQVEATAPGFKKVVRRNIEVRIADRIEVDVALEIGASEQSVTITAESPLMNTE